MRLIMTFAIAVTVSMMTLGAVASWADGKSRAQPQAGGAAIDPFAMMVSVKDLPTPGYGDPF
jgi:hypothetical protein